MAQEGYRLPVRLPRLPAIGDMGGQSYTLVDFSLLIDFL
jgi:hypothetical protein